MSYFFSYVYSMLNVIMALFYDANVFNELKAKRRNENNVKLGRKNIETTLKSQT